MEARETRRPGSPPFFRGRRASRHGIIQAMASSLTHLLQLALGFELIAFAVAVAVFESRLAERGEPGKTREPAAEPSETAGRTPTRGRSITAVKVFAHTSRAH